MSTTAPGVTDLTLDYLRPIVGSDGVPALHGIGIRRPRILWRTDNNDGGRHASELIQVTWSPDEGAQYVSGMIEASIGYLDWPFPALEAFSSGQLLLQQVGGDAATLFVTVGPLSPSDWSGRFIGDGTSDADVLEFFTSLKLDAVPEQTELYLAPVGSVVCRVNGQPVHDKIVAPGRAKCPHRVRYRAHDVTSLLRPGANLVELTVGQCWNPTGEEADFQTRYGEMLGAFAELFAFARNGWTSLLATGPDWRVRDSSILAAGIYDEQTETLEPRQRASRQVEITGWDVEALTPAESPQVRVTETIPARTIVVTTAGRLIADFGQNLVGFCRVRVQAGDAREIIVRHTEVLDHGERASGPLRSAQATDRYLLGPSDHDVELQPEHTYHGFRYAELSGVSLAEVKEISACVVSSDH